MDQPGTRFSPKKYWIPSVVVTFQYSPLSSPFPLAESVSFSNFVPSSAFVRQVPSEALISSPPLPFQVTVALS
ncbi:hypothetical protein [Actinomadura atramentaria]|uniref:hypothetical protein n=1 Tax=Actinomadura atramentaria TaxID=1990 RepID=UPI000368A134|nr:hypothetical protein [Actinomadura atramentaria]